MREWVMAKTPKRRSGGGEQFRIGARVQQWEYSINDVYFWWRKITEDMVDISVDGGWFGTFSPKLYVRMRCLLFPLRIMNLPSFCIIWVLQYFRVYELIEDGEGEYQKGGKAWRPITEVWRRWWWGRGFDFLEMFLIVFHIWFQKYLSVPLLQI